MDLAALRRLWPVVAVALLLGAAALAAGHSTLRFTRVPPAVEELPGLPDDAYQLPTGPPSPRPVAGAEPAATPRWLTTVAIGLCVAGAVFVVVLLLRAVVRDVLRRRVRRGRRSAGASTARTTADVVAAVDAGLVDLSDSDADPRRAVIACWVRLEQAAAAAGTPRRIGDTPTDLVTRLLAGERPDGGPAIVSAEVLAAFAGVYREARYATHAVDERMRTQARTALERLRRELTAEVAS